MRPWQQPWVCTLKTTPSQQPCVETLFHILLPHMNTSLQILQHFSNLHCCEPPVNFTTRWIDCVSPGGPFFHQFALRSESWPRAALRGGRYKEFLQRVCKECDYWACSLEDDSRSSQNIKKHQKHQKRISKHTDKSGQIQRSAISTSPKT